MKNLRMHRRGFAQTLAGTGVALAGGLFDLKARGDAAPGRRVLEIFLKGGWDSALATDPIVRDKAASGAYEGAVQALATRAVSGKPNLILGNGLLAAESAFASMPTAFINGIRMEVTAHTFAEGYMYSGKSTTSSTRVAPALTALLGNAKGGFPAHLVIGTAIPLGETTFTSPPLQANSPRALADSLTPPGTSEGFQAESLAIADQLIRDLDQHRKANLSQLAINSLAPWTNASQSLGPIYGANYGSLLTLNDATKARYGYKDDGDIGARLASAYLALKSGLTSFVAVNFGDFDTHSNHLGQHLPVMQEFGGALAALVSDLRATPDPGVPGSSLADTTMIVITSEFTRTPKFNGSAGTDHWPSASMIVMGGGVRDNSVHGATDADASVLGWRDGPLALSDETALMPDHVVAAILYNLGLADAANDVSGVRLDALFA